MLTHRFYLWQGRRHPDRRIVLNIDRRVCMNSERFDFDWGPGVTPSWRRPLAAGLLFHALGAKCPPDMIEAFSAEVVAHFPETEFAITGDQIAAWVQQFQKAGRRHG